MKRRRLRKWAKWACTVAAVLAMAAAVVSRFYRYERIGEVRSDRTVWWVRVHEGLFLLAFDRFSGPDYFPPTPQWSMTRMGGWHWGLPSEAADFGGMWAWHAGVLYMRNADGSILGVSLMYPVALTLIPAALLWYADRRRHRPGSCGGCGYDRAGLAPTSPCPECGTSSSP
jgi:hypothetical protein